MELVDKYDNKRRPLNKTSERRDKIDGEYRLSTHIWIINSNGILIQKRAITKKKNPDKWSIHGGAVDAGETTLSAAIRETHEEVGIDLSEDDLELMISYKHKYTITDVYLTKKEIPIEAVTIQKEEVQEAKYVSFEEFEQMILDGVVADNITEYYPYFKTICSYT